MEEYLIVSMNFMNEKCMDDWFRGLVVRILDSIILLVFKTIVVG